MRSSRYRHEAGADIPEPTAYAFALRYRRLREIPLRHHPVFLEAWDGGPPEAAIRAQCLECCGYSEAEVQRCGAWDCPLFFHRRGKL